MIFEEGKLVSPCCFDLTNGTSKGGTKDQTVYAAFPLVHQMRVIELMAKRPVVD